MSQLELFCTRFSAKSSTLLFCFIKDSAASQAELIFWSLVTHVVSIDSVACRSRSRISAIFCSAACETSRSASWELSRSSETVWWNTVIFCSAACKTSRLASWALSRNSETVSNRFLEIVFPCSAHYSIRYDVYFLVVRCFVEQINVMVFTIRHDAKMIYSSFINPLTPKSDQHLISPYNITPDLHIKVTRIQEMVTN